MLTIMQNLFAHAFHIAAFFVQRLKIYSRRKIEERMAQPVAERVERTVESFEHLVEASAAARESVICVDDLEVRFTLEERRPARA